MDSNENTQPTDWNKRFTDPMTRWKWDAATKVDRADTDKGIKNGVINYPDGSKRAFTRVR